MSTFTFKPGFIYSAGIDLPAVLSLASLRDGSVEQGFEPLVVEECKNYPLPFMTPGHRCGDTYDTVTIARRVGPKAELEVPSEVKWVIEHSPSMLPPPREAPPVQPGSAGAGTGWTMLSLAGTSAGAYYGYKKKRSVGWALAGAVAGGVAPLLLRKLVSP